MRLLFLITISLFLTDTYAQQKIKLKNLGKKVNTRYHEGAPIISSDGNTLYFFVTNHPQNTYGKEGSQDIWYSKKQADGSWGQARHLAKPLNHHHSNEVFKAFTDGKSIFIRGGRKKNSKGFSFSYKQGSAWGSPQELEVENFKNMNLGRFYGATMSDDKKVMIIYMSEKEHSKFSDLYVSFPKSDGKWSVPKKIGSPINTSRDEFAPFLASDNKTLYYSSSRKDKGLGGPDIYKTTRLDNTWLKWSEPVNMGKPINTRAFDAYMSVDDHGNLFVTSAGDMRDGGNLDIFTLKPKDPELKLTTVVSNKKTEETIAAQVVYKAHRHGTDTTVHIDEEGTYDLVFLKNGSFEIHIKSEGFEDMNTTLNIPNFKADTTMLVEYAMIPIPEKPHIYGTVYDKKTNEKIDAKVMYSSALSIKKIRLKTDDGFFDHRVDKKTMYYFDVSKAGYISTTDSLDITDIEDPVSEGKDIYLVPIEIGTTVRLDRIYFDFDKATLKPASFEELDKVVKFLNDNSSISIEIGGHTDSKGADDYNQRLSQARAESVVEYLSENGIDPNRLSAKGYGETQPEATNETDEGRAINRRVVFTVLEK